MVDSRVSKKKIVNNSKFGTPSSEDQIHLLQKKINTDSKKDAPEFLEDAGYSNQKDDRRMSFDEKLARYFSIS